MTACFVQIPKLIVRVRLRVNVRVKPGVSPMAGGGSRRQTGLMQPDNTMKRPPAPGCSSPLAR